MLITLGGKAGSGKGTVAKLLANALHYDIISIGDMKRTLAKEMGLNIQDFNLLGDKPENQQEFDLKYEEYQKNLKLTDKVILDSRLGFYAQPHAFKILLDVDETVAGQRIFGANRKTDVFSTLEEALAEVKARNLKDQQRYKKLYNIEVWKYENYTLVIDTTERTPEEIVDIILKEFEARQLKHKKGNGKNKAETPPLSKANRKPSLLKNVLLLLALGVIVGIRVVAVMLAN